ncbi:MAG: Methylase of polypeptide chain release factor [Rhodospirillales bacterium]|nr:Methylase of polypeptide chain release factor [Rhodospirillales bacterium]
MADLAEVLQNIERQLTAAGIDSARTDARIIVAQATGIDRAKLIGQTNNMAKAALTEQQTARIAELAARRAKHEPIALIVGTREFWSLVFRVGPATLIPRPDSETLIEAALEYCPDRTRPYRILDLGTGSGCLLLALLSELPNATGLGIDASQDALDIAQGNADSLGLARRAAFAWGDWTSNLDPDRDGRFDIIVSNPPYITKPDWEKLEDDVRLYEPRTALVGGLDGLNPYRAFGPHLPDLLTEEGIFVCEIGAGQAIEVGEILADAGLTVLGARNDLAGIERCLLATRPQQ